jgi:lysophospholipase L1-like esterase
MAAGTEAEAREPRHHGWYRQFARRCITRATVGVTLAAALVTGFLGAGIGTASATTATTATTAAPGAYFSTPGYYLALGDSVAFGYRPPQVTTTAQYANADNFVGYPTDVAAAENLVLVNASCPGETTASMLSATAQSNGCENSYNPSSSTNPVPGGYRTTSPLHVSYTGSQIAFAEQFLKAHPTTRLITLDIGANDAFICEATPGTKNCTTSTALANLATQIDTNLTTIYKDLRGTGYTGPIVTLDYYSTDYASTAGDEGTQYLNAVINKPSTSVNPPVITANGYAAFETPSSAFGGSTCAAGLLVKLPNGTCNVHPTLYGHRLLAQAIEQALTSAKVSVANPPGYRMAAADGGMFAFGGSAFDGSGAGSSATATSKVVGVAEVPGGGGYWMVTAAGTVLPFGDAATFPTLPASVLGSPVVGIAATPEGQGYWLVTSNGGVFSFGDAGFYGSMGGKPLNKPIVGIAAAPYGGGYWEVAADGGIFAFGDAQFYGSMGGKPLNKPIVGIAATPDGGGYWEVAADGGIFAFGDAGFYGSMGGKPLNKPIVGIAATPDSGGYWEVAADGGIFAFGDAQFDGSMGGKPLDEPVVGMAATG